MRHTLAPRRGMASGRGFRIERVRAAVPGGMRRFPAPPVRRRELCAPWHELPGAAAATDGVRRYALPLARTRKLNGSE